MIDLLDKKIINRYKKQKIMERIISFWYLRHKKEKYQNRQFNTTLIYKYMAQIGCYGVERDHWLKQHPFFFWWFFLWSSHQRCSVKKGVLRNFAKFTGKRLCQSLFFNKVAGVYQSVHITSTKVDISVSKYNTNNKPELL